MDLNHLKISYKKILLTKNIADYQCLLNGAASGSRTRTTLGHRILSPSRLPIPTPPHNLKTALKLIISQSRQPLRQFSFERTQDSNLQKGSLLLLSFLLVGQEGVEPSSSGFSVQRSDRISYQPTYIYNLFFFSYNPYA